MRLFRLLLPLVACLAAPPALAACPPEEAVAAVAEAFLERSTVASYPGPLSRADALCAQGRLVARLEQAMGPPVGWKVGLSNPKQQALFKADGPIRGVLLRDMMAPRGPRTAAAFGARPGFEADLLVRVKDAAVMEARTPEEAARHLSEVIPFLELVDIMVAEGQPIDAGQIEANNIGARGGVAGRPLPMTPELVPALAAMRVVLADGAGKELAAAPGTAVLGHPLNAVLWLAADLKRAGLSLKQGDLVSVGSFSVLMPARPGLSLTLRYEGLPGAEPLSVAFD